jgi:hypothetical protein
VHDPQRAIVRRRQINKLHAFLVRKLPHTLRVKT